MTEVSERLSALNIESVKARDELRGRVVDLDKRLTAWVDGREDQAGSSRQMMKSVVESYLQKAKLTYFGFGLGLAAAFAVISYALTKM